MTTRWEKGDSHALLIAEGESTNCKDFKKALEIDFNGNILIDCMSFSAFDEESITHLGDFAKLTESRTRLTTHGLIAEPSLMPT